MLLPVPSIDLARGEALFCADLVGADGDFIRLGGCSDRRA